MPAVATDEGIHSMTSLRVDPDRLLPTDPAVRAVARRIYEAIADLPIVSPHGHVDPGLLLSDEPFTDPASLFVTSDHYVTRMLHAHGVPLDELGLGDPASAASPREVWRMLCTHWWTFRGTPSRYWLESELSQVLGVSEAPDASTADVLFDQLSGRLSEPEMRPRALYDRFHIAVLATTDDPCSDLAVHQALRDDPTWKGRIVPTFRPDAYLNVEAPDWNNHADRLADVSDVDTGSYSGFVAAIELRRQFFVDHGATSTDYGPIDADSTRLSPDVASRIYADARGGTATPADRAQLRRHLLFEMARMSSEDGMVMQLHPGVVRNHHQPTSDHFGGDTGHDIPVAMEFTGALRPLLNEFGTNPRFRLVVFTVDETTWSRELAPLAGFYPAVYVGAPWWFLDSPEGMRRFRRAVTDTIGFFKSSGFIDDTRAFCSIPARHDTARRVDAGYLAELVATHVLPEDEAVATAVAITDRLPREVFRLT
jgi:glucuronate isomerase